MRGEAGILDGRSRNFRLLNARSLASSLSLSLFFPALRIKIKGGGLACPLSWLA